jgi:hypothetical protein
MGRFIGDVYGIVCIEPLFSRLCAQQCVQTCDILRNCNLERPFRLIARGGYGDGREIRGLVDTVDEAIFTDNRRGAYMNVGGVLAGGGGLSCKLQAGVGALDLIYKGSFTRPWITWGCSLHRIVKRMSNAEIGFMPKPPFSALCNMSSVNAPSTTSHFLSPCSIVMPTFLPCGYNVAPGKVMPTENGSAFGRHIQRKLSRLSCGFCGLRPGRTACRDAAGQEDKH